MPILQNCIPFILTKQEIITLLQKVQQNIKISQLDNLRQRHANIQFDCMLRGCVGEYALQKWFTENNIIIDKTNYSIEQDAVDIDFFYKNKNIELKTSLVPDADVTIENAIKKRDIKIIKREEKIEDVRGDIHVQIFFNQKRKAKDTWLKQQAINLLSHDYEYLYNALLAKSYTNTTYFVGWVDKPTLINNINNLIQKKESPTWTFPSSLKEFWCCKINNVHHPISLINYLNTL